MFHFIRRRKQYAKEQGRIYKTERKKARFDKVFNRGYDDEYKR